MSSTRTAVREAGASPRGLGGEEALAPPYTDGKMEAENLPHWYLLHWRKCAVFAGRTPRREYWFFHLGNSLIGVFFSLAAVIPSLAVSIRRLHDINLSSWWFLVTLIPILAPIALFVFTLIPGTPGENRFGPEPRKA